VAPGAADEGASWGRRRLGGRLLEGHSRLAPAPSLVGGGVAVPLSLLRKTPICTASPLLLAPA
jgi:hypothetical protein